MPVPDRFRIDHDIRPVLALVEASGLIGAHSSFESAFGEFLLEQLLQPGFGGGIATSSGMACRALVSADKDVFFELWHESNALSDII